MTLVVRAPVAGTALAMDEVADPVFAQSLVGPGLALDPARDGDVDVVSPVDGTLLKLQPHAFIVRAEDGHAVLVHLGIDTVQLGGEGFTLHAEEGSAVTAGQRLVTWSPAAVEAGGRSPVSPVVALEGSAEQLTLLAVRGGAVAAGDPLFEWGSDA